MKKVEMSKDIQKPYPFNGRGNVEEIKTCLAYGYYQKLADGKQLSRHEKNSLFHTLQSNGGKYNYRVMGVVIPFKQFMTRYFVTYKYLGVQEIWAFDKTCIRSSFYTNRGINEILELK